MSNTTYRVFTEKLGGTRADDFIGDPGDIFYDPANGIIRLSDGSSNGGVVVSGGGGGGAFDPTQYYTRAYTDGLFANVVGTANSQGNTLGKLQTSLSSYVPLAGGTLTGPLNYATQATSATELTNKSYVDTKVNTAISSLNTSMVSENTNLYFTTNRVVNTISNPVNTPGLVRSVNGNTPDASGAVTIAVGANNVGIVRSVNGNNPDGSGAVVIPGLVTSVNGNNPNSSGGVTIAGLVKTVNGIAPDSNGAVSISITATQTGNLANRPNSANAGLVYVVSNDTNANNNGKTFIYEANSASWYEVATSDTAANDARYVNVSGDAMTGPLVLAGAPTSNLHASTKAYVDTTVSAMTLDGLADVVSANPSAGQVMAFNGNNWVAANVAAKLDDLLDVNTTSATNGQSIVLSGNTWVAANVATRIDDLLDVDSTTAANGQVLTLSGNTWIAANTVSKLGDLVDVSNTAPGTGYVLGWDSANSEWAPIASAAAPTLASLLDVDVAGLANTSTLQYNAPSSKWKVATPEPKKKTMLADHGIGFGRSHVYGNEVFCAGFDGSGRIHSWNNAGTVRMSLSAPFVSRPPEILKLVDGVSYQHVLGSDGILYSRGRDEEGQQGTGGITGRPVTDSNSAFRPNIDPKIYGPGIKVTNVWSHRKHHWDGAEGGCLFVEVDDNGTKKLYAAGYNSNGLLGIGGALNTNALTALPQLDGKGIKKIDNFSFITMFVTENGELWGAGFNHNGAIGADFIGSTSLTPSRFANGSVVTGAVDVQASFVAGVGTQSWFLRDDGTVWGSGSNGEGNLCNGAAGDVTKFRQVLTAANTPITGVTKILEVGRGQLLMHKSDGTVWATGRNHDGCFGNSTFPIYTSIGLFTRQIQSDIQDFWSFGGEINGYCQVFWKKNDKMFFSGTNFNYTGGSFTEALAGGNYNFLQPIESLDGKNVIDVKPISKINSDGSGLYRNTMFLTDTGEIYVAGLSAWCFVMNDGDDIYFKTTYKLTDYLGGATETVYVTKNVVQATAMDELSDVNAPAPTVGQVLVYNGTNWVPTSLTQLNSAQPGGLLQTVAYDLVNDAVPEISRNGYTAGNLVTEINIDVRITPKSNNSRFLVTYDGEFVFSGTGSDEFTSTLTETSTSTNMRFVRQTNVTTPREMGRSNVLLPIIGTYRNTSLTQKTFRLRIARSSGDEQVQLWNSMVIIQEVSQ